MKKYLLWAIAVIIGVLGFTVKANAATAPSTITTGSVIVLHQYVPGLTAYYKPLVGGGTAYCEVAGLKYTTGITMRVVGTVDDGFVYIMNNKPNTGDANRDYYILQVATWWYKDIITNSNNNLSQSIKAYMNAHVGDNIACKKIVDLVNGAQHFKQSTGSIAFSSGDVKFTQNGNYYVSDTITLTSKELSSVGNITLNDAPSGTALYNTNISNGNGTFQIRVPVASVKEGSTVNFSIKVIGTYKIGKVYEYYYSSNYQKVILDQVYNTYYDVNTTKNFSITRTPTPVEEHNQLSIAKVDESGSRVVGATLTLYKGNCTNSVCTNEYETWSTSTGLKTFTDIAVGTYTLVETKTPDGYRTASKMLINVDSKNKTYTYSMVDYHKSKVRISKTDVTGEKELPGATLLLTDSTGKEVATWVSTSEAKYFTLDEGVYNLTETIAPEGYVKSSTTITFKVDASGNVYEKNSNGAYTKVEYIKMVNDVKPVVNINKLDSESNEYVVGAKLVLKDSTGKTVETWSTANESHYVTLNPGEYVLAEESAPDGYILNSAPIYFKIDAAGKLLVKNDQNIYVDANGIIMYDAPKGEVVVVPQTGLSSNLTYIVGTLTIAAGAIMLIKYGKKC